MEEEQESTAQENGSMTYYIVGAVVLVLIAAGAYVLRPKATTNPAPVATQEQVPAVATPTPGPITGLACERQWYNQKIGFNEYYIGVDGSDLMTTKKVTCSFSLSVAGKVVATTSAESTLTDVASRGGGTFMCNSPAVALEPNVATVVDVMLKNDTNKTASCTQTFVFPQ